MTNYIEYELSNGETILIEATDSDQGGFDQVSDRGRTVTKADRGFRQALGSVKQSAQIFVNEMSTLEVDEMEVTFGITTAGELGNFAVGKVGLEANYQVTLKWKRGKQE